MSKREGKRSTRRCLAYITAFVVFQTAIILLFVLIFMRVRSPKIRFNAIAVESFSSTNSTSAPSINMGLLTQVDIKNANFGHFKYNNSTLTVLYDGVPLGEVVIPRGRARARKTRRFEVAVDLNSQRLSGNRNLGNDINSGILRLRSEGRVSGKVHLMKVFRRNKSGSMNCDWSINLGTRQVENLTCN